MKKKLDIVIGFSYVNIDARSSANRLTETALGKRTQKFTFSGNFVTDIIRRELKADCVMLNGGSFRSDLNTDAGPFTLGRLLEVFPFEDVIVLMEVNGLQVSRANF